MRPENRTCSRSVDEVSNAKVAVGSSHLLPHYLKLLDGDRKNGAEFFDRYRTIAYDAHRTRCRPTAHRTVALADP